VHGLHPVSGPLLTRSIAVAGPAGKDVLAKEAVSRTAHAGDKESCDGDGLSGGDDDPEYEAGEDAESESSEDRGEDSGVDSMYDDKGRRPMDLHLLMQWVPSDSVCPNQ
jgi:hypothetical protein